MRQLYEVNHKYFEFVWSSWPAQKWTISTNGISFDCLKTFIYLFSFIALKYIVYTYIWLLKNANLI